MSSMLEGVLASLLGHLAAATVVPLFKVVRILPKFDFRVVPDRYGSALTLNLQVRNKPMGVLGGLPVRVSASLLLVAQDGRHYPYPDLLWSTASGDKEEIEMRVDSTVFHALQVLRVEDGIAFVPSGLKGTRTVPNGVYSILITLSYDRFERKYWFENRWSVPELRIVQ